MEKFMGTPGPWEMDEFETIVHGQMDNWGRKNTVRVSGVSLPGRVTGEDRANSKLVTAAPELLEALQELVLLYEHDEGCRELTEYKRAKAAINKALGK
ncbi:hypothetical protein [Pluralibacter gergoviae]|uniref:hypothetical protein n=1 Tax=Pluralibacter gergoviae TaxID=61647 RepID=UPI00290833A1|nr:hypothetical protein [Pluralibacter gergoviae]MDU4001401.1 hypothetical protein [Pluralibacter gergoviae]